MKYIKLALSSLLVLVSASQFLIYGFLAPMILWLVYSLLYLGISVFQKFHFSSVLSQTISLVYILLPLIGLTVYCFKEGFSKMTQTFYIVLMIVLSLSLVWEIISLCLVLREKK